MNKYCYLLASVVFFQGCSSINQPTASRPLVEHTYIGESRPESDDMQIVLSRNAEGDSFRAKNETGVVGAEFFSATGVRCKKVTFVNGGPLVFCLNGLKQWYKVRPVISQYNKNPSRTAQ